MYWPGSRMSKTPDKTPQSLPTKKEQQTSVVTTGLHFSGPLPPPAVLEGYERIVPEAAEHLISLVEADAKHQQEIEITALRAEISGYRLGQGLGFTIATIALLVSGVCAYFGHEWPASIIGGSTVVGLVYAFVLGRNPNGPKESDSKKK